MPFGPGEFIQELTEVELGNGGGEPGHVYFLLRLPVALAAATTGLQIRSQLIDSCTLHRSIRGATALGYVRSTNLKWYSTSSGSQVGHPGS